MSFWLDSNLPEIKRLNPVEVLTDEAGKSEILNFIFRCSSHFYLETADRRIAGKA